MADMKRLALQRKLVAAEGMGDTARAERLRAALGETEPAAAAPAAADTEPAGLDAVAFASPAARSAAEEAGMSAESFKRRRKSSDAGFTKADVERIAANEEDSD